MAEDEGHESFEDLEGRGEVEGMPFAMEEGGDAGGEEDAPEVGDVGVVIDGGVEAEIASGAGEERDGLDALDVILATPVEALEIDAVLDPVAPVDFGEVA